MKSLTPSQVLYIYEDCVDGRIEGIWDLVAPDVQGIVPSLPRETETFELRREVFFEAVETLVRLGYTRLVYEWESGFPPLEGTVEEQISRLRENFPTQESELELKDGTSWFDTAGCLYGTVWEWPGRKPVPLFPGHNPRFMYIERGWDGRIDPEWEHWKFTPGRKKLDDFESR